jgi:hypothetical protein
MVSCRYRNENGYVMLFFNKGIGRSVDKSVYSSR